MNMLDRVSVSTIEKLKLKKEFSSLNSTKNSLSGLAKLKANKRLSEIGGILGWDFNRSQQPTAQVAQNDQPEIVQQAQEDQGAPTAKHYDNSEKRTLTRRQKDNDAAIALLRSIQAEGRTTATEEEKAILAKYSGNGGGLIDADGNKGSAYEYYTPPFVAQAAWNLMKEMGFSGGKVLDPCAGTGVFASTKPKGVMIEQVELDSVSGAINALVNNSTTTTTTVSPYEKVAASTDDESYDAVVSNVPFGTKADRGSNYKHDKKYQDFDLAPYFIMRSIDKLKPNGLAMFVLPHGVINSKSADMEKLRYQVSKRAEFIGAYRLPNKIFKDTSNADAIVDIAIFKKHSESLKDKITESKEEDLRTANVLWDEFISGRYFQESGKKYQFGDFVERDKSNMHSRDQVKTDMSVSEMMAAMRKFGGSRIKWDMLNTAESQVITYQDGDTQFIDGQQMTFKRGQWVIAEPVQDTESENLIALQSQLKDPYDAVIADISYQQAKDFLSIMSKRGLSGRVEDWLKSTLNQVEQVEQSAKDQAFRIVCIGLGIRDLVAKHGVGENYFASYHIFSEAIAKYAIKANATRSMLSSSWAKDACQELPLVYSKSDGFSAFWRGDIGNLGKDDADLSAKQKYSKIKYQFADDYGYVPIEKMKELNPDFDPFNDDNYCISHDGKRVIDANEFYQGTLAEVTKNIDDAIQAASSPDVIQKLMRQKKEAENRINKIDVDRMTFNLVTPYLTDEQKLQFLRQQVHPDFGFDIDKEGNRLIRFVGNTDDIENKLLARLAYYMSGSSKGNLSLQGIGKVDGAYIDGEEQKLLTRLRNLAGNTNAKIGVWAKSDPMIKEMLDKRLNAPENLTFRRYEEEDALTIEGKHPDFNPHPYQFAEIKRQSKHFGGINGFGVGLGKTATSLLSVQYAQSIGVKRKTLFVVPNAVLSNWYKEAVTGKGKKGEDGYQPPVLLNGNDRCLFVGMDFDKSGKPTVKSSNYANDMKRILENKHSMIFMSLEAFTRIPLKDETIGKYKSWLMDNDSALAIKTSANDEKQRKSIERAESKAEKAVNDVEKRNVFPFFEDMGFDSMVMDEAHQFKNSKTLFSFKGAKFLSVAPASDRGSDAMVKAWYLRGLSPKGDGVLALTATPITNSPLEIYSMLSLSMGEKSLSKRIGGIDGADAFMEATTNIEEREDIDIVGRPRVARMFMGIQNVSILTNVLHDIANIKDASDVGATVKLPKAKELATSVSLNGNAMAELNEMKDLYKAARMIIKDKGDELTLSQINMLTSRVGLPLCTGKPSDVLNTIEALKNEADIKLLGHPFNLINKMTNRVIDEDLYRGILTLNVVASQADKARKLVETWNKKPPSEERGSNSSFTQESDVTMLKDQDVDDGSEEQATMKVKVRAFISDDGKTITLDTSSYKFHDAFYEMALKAGLTVSTGISEKVAAFIENYKKEQATPIGGSFSKQIVFVDQLGMHIKIKMALTQYCGVEPSKIVVISGQAISDPADMQDAQDGFNGDGDENKYHTVIANKKAEVGINLQKRTQAIHHLTIGWTPDSLTQRNGRGVRQGNILDDVTVYHYDAKGTFDEYKRELVNKKDEWISELMNGSGDKVMIAEGLSDQEYDDLIMAGDDQEMIAKIKQEAESRQKAKLADSAKRTQSQMMAVLKTQSDNIKLLENDLSYIAVLAQEHFDTINRIEQLKRSLSSMTKQDSINRAKDFLSDSELRLEELNRLFLNGVLFGSNKEQMTQEAKILKDGDYYRTIYDTKGKNKKIERLKWSVSGIAKDSDLDKFRNAEIAKSKTAFEKSKLNFEQAGSGIDGAYGDSTIDDIVNGDAVSANGVIISVGMVAIDSQKNVFIVEKEKGKLGYWTPDRLFLVPIDSISSVSLFDSSNKEQWDMVLATMAKKDDEFISKNEITIGSSKRLYSYRFPEILPLLENEPMAKYSDVFSFNNGVKLKSPLFPKLTGSIGVIDSFGDASETKLMRFIFEQQKDVVSYDGDSVLIKNPFDLKDNSRSLGLDEIASFVVANDIKICSGDFNWLASSFFNKERLLSAITELDGIKDVRNDIEKLCDDAMDGKIESVELFESKIKSLITVFSCKIFDESFIKKLDDDNFILLKDKVINYTLDKKVIKSLEAIANGGKSIFWYHEELAYSKAKGSIKEVLEKKIVENFERYISESDELIDFDDIMGKSFTEFFISKKHDQLNAFYVQDWVIDLIKTLVTSPDGVVLIRNVNDTGLSGNGYWKTLLRNKLTEFKSKKATNSINIAGMTLDEVIEKIKSIEGVEQAKIGTISRLRSSSRFSGAFKFGELDHIEVDTTYGNANISRMSDGKNGIAGRTWFKHCWLFSLDDNAKDDQGSKVASVMDLLKFFDKV